MQLSLTIVNVNVVFRSGGSNIVWSSSGSLFEAQIYTLNADSDIMHVFITWGINRLCSFTNWGELYADSLRGLPKLGRWLCFGINLSLLSTSSSTPYEHHISHSHPYSLRMASRLRIQRLISTFPLAPMNHRCHPHYQPYRASRGPWTPELPTLANIL